MNGLQRIDQHAKLSGLSGLLAYGYTVALMEFKRRFPKGPRPMLDTTYRGPVEQNKLFAQGRTTKGPIVTTKLFPSSKHNKTPAQAFDIKMVWPDGEVDWDPDLFHDFNDCMKTSGIEYTWGGTWEKLVDRPHFEV